MNEKTYYESDNFDGNHDKEIQSPTFDERKLSINKSILRLDKTDKEKMLKSVIMGVNSNDVDFESDDSSNEPYSRNLKLKSDFSEGTQLNATIRLVQESRIGKNRMQKVKSTNQTDEPSTTKAQGFARNNENYAKPVKEYYSKSKEPSVRLNAESPNVATT